MLKELQDLAKKLDEAQKALENATKAEKANADQQVAKITALENELKTLATQHKNALQTVQEKLEGALKNNSDLHANAVSHTENLQATQKTLEDTQKKLAEKSQQVERLTAQLNSLRTINSDLTKKNKSLRESNAVATSTAEASTSSSSIPQNNSNNDTHSPELRASQSLDFYTKTSLDELITHVQNPETTSFPKSSDGRSIFQALSTRNYQESDLEKLTTLARSIYQKDRSIFSKSEKESNPLFMAISRGNKVFFKAMQGLVDLTEKNRSGQSLLAFACFQIKIPGSRYEVMPSAEIITDLIQSTHDANEFTTPYEFPTVGLQSAKSLLRLLAQKYPMHPEYANAVQLMESRTAALVTRHAPPPPPTLFRSTPPVGALLPRPVGDVSTSKAASSPRLFKLQAKLTSNAAKALNSLGKRNNDQTSDVDKETQTEKRPATQHGQQ